MKGPNFEPFTENEKGISINLLLINSAVIALVTKSPTKKTTSHSKPFALCIVDKITLFGFINIFCGENIL